MSNGEGVSSWARGGSHTFAPSAVCAVTEYVPTGTVGLNCSGTIPAVFIFQCFLFFISRTWLHQEGFSPTIAI